MCCIRRRRDGSRERHEDKKSKADEEKKDTRETRKDSDRTRAVKHNKTTRNRSRSRDNDSEQEDARYANCMAENLVAKNFIKIFTVSIPLTVSGILSSGS